MDTAHFQICAQPVGGRIHINGQDVTGRLAAVNVRLGHSEPTVLTAHLIAGADPSTIEGRGIVHVAVDVDPVQAIVEFLARIDPQQLEQDAMMLVGDGTLTQKMLSILADRAEAGG